MYILIQRIEGKSGIMVIMTAIVLNRPNKLIIKKKEEENVRML